MVLQVLTDSDIKCVSALNVMRNMLITNSVLSISDG